MKIQEAEVITERGIKRNALSLEDKFPCEIQLERLKSNGKYRGNTTIIENGEKITLSNVFTVTAYRKELEKFFDVQKKYHDFISKGFTDRYFDIFNRKRKYYDGREMNCQGQITVNTRRK